jgi:hypothetical protein
MTDPVVTDASKVLAETKSVIATLESDVAKVKTFWTDYRLYIVCTLCLIVGIVLGAKVHL